MCKKFTYSTLFPLVLSVVVSSAANATDPSLVGWWRLDETSGKTARDSSGNGNDGTLFGNPQWDAGMIGGALHLDDASSDYVEIPFSEHLKVLNESDFTHTAWVNFDEVNRKQQILMQGNLNGLGRPSFFITGSGAVQSWLGGGGTFAGFFLETGQWYHLAVIVTENGSIDSIQLFVNGEATGNPGQMGMESCEGVYLIGRHKMNQAEFMDGLVDDVRMYNRALTESELHDAMLGIDMTPALASEPYPADGATDVPSDVVLSWKPGAYAPAVNGHKVYLSKSIDDVSNGIGGITVDNSSYAPPQRLDFDTTYYWGVDEANSVSGWDQGIIWQFEVESFVYPITSENITVTASSALQSMGPENTVNASGLNADDLHSTLATDMWLSSSEPNGAWIQYEFDKAYKLHELWVWNSNQLVESIVGFGVKEVVVEYSEDGLEWKILEGVSEFAQSPGAEGYAHDTVVRFDGAVAMFIKINALSNWGGLAQYGLSEVRFFCIPVHAGAPQPESGAIGQDMDITLSWKSGREAAAHNVYLDADRQAVLDGIAPVATVTEPRYTVQSLNVNTTYYWRVDEVNETEIPAIWQGDVWSFTTREFLVVDDFESYTDDDTAGKAVWKSWTDGFGVPDNGAQVGYLLPPYAEQTIVHSGLQSMPLSYDNTVGVTNSEAALALTALRDWTKHDIDVLSLWFRGNPASVGSFVEVPAGTYTMTGSGTDITGTADQFHSAFKTLNGPGSIVARVNSIENTHAWAKAGVMIRETLDAGSKHAFACVTPENGVATQGRTALDGTSFSTNQAGITAPHWVKLERDAAGNFTVSHSANGTLWEPVGSTVPTNISMTSSVHIGLALTSHDAALTCQAVFSNVAMIGNVSGQWVHQDVGITSNAAEPMYVALSNADGASAVVANDDPTACTMNIWTEWVIPLQAFADQGINLTDVDKIAIGLGSKGGAASGGTGTVYIDDIRLYRP